MSYTVPLLLNGKEIISSTTIPVTSPVSHKPIWSYSSASSADADAAVAAASAAFPAWSKTKPAARRNILLKAADLLQERGEELKTHMFEETGSPLGFGEFNVFTAAELIRDAAGRISSIAGSIPICKDEGTSALVLKEPYGVVLAIAPWNAPYILGVRSALYPLATGNTCVLKGSELSPRCFYHIGRAFTDAGLPPGALNIIYTARTESPAITAQLIAAPAIRKINFTGSTAVGSVVAAAAGKALKPCLLELGGKAAAIILEDADLERAAMQCAIGSFLHAGQICMATERILVCASVMDAFRPLLQQAIAGFAPGEGLASVLVQGPAVTRNQALVADALEKGAKLLYGDHTAAERHPETGEVSATRMRPVVVEGVTAEMALYREESFGPSVSLIAVKDEDEAIAISNESDYGLNSAVFTRDLARGIRVAKRMECGSIHINSMSVHDEAVLPHGGVKSSGWGRFNAQAGFDEFLRTKTVTFQE
ncbi:aldehyde dehydrogenase domain-containing protein [Mycena alexandri]|uniref:Aldehyde dehydrogenase domain-containing protein n=1 Tax=Mycena alexandri TaxID=1745969 RepID=A0AAD6XCB4_9AGAR|nr:aldehyde dehydrogenase domain-containing protein [Mycena alexandri]